MNKKIIASFYLTITIACYKVRILRKKDRSVTLYLTILTFYLTIARLYVEILTSFLRIVRYKLAIASYQANSKGRKKD